MMYGQYPLLNRFSFALRFHQQISVCKSLFSLISSQSPSRKVPSRIPPPSLTNENFRRKLAQNAKLSKGVTQFAHKHPPIDDRSGITNPAVHCIRLPKARKSLRREERTSRIFFTSSFANISRSYQQLKCLQASKTGKAIETTVLLAGIQEG